MSRHLPVIFTASIALAFSACETTPTQTVETTTVTRNTASEQGRRRVVEDSPSSSPTPKPERITAVEEDAPPTIVEPAVTPMPTPVVQDYQTATPVEGKPGFVKSPFGGSGIVDVRGYPPGTEVKDPYTGKVFLVP